MIRPVLTILKSLLTVEYSKGQNVTLGGVSYYVVEDSLVLDENVKLLRKDVSEGGSWKEARSSAENYASSLGYTSAQAWSRLIMRDEVDALPSSIRMVGREYWTGTGCDDTALTQWWAIYVNSDGVVCTSYDRPDYVACAQFWLS